MLVADRPVKLLSRPISDTIQHHLPTPAKRKIRLRMLLQHLHKPRQTIPIREPVIVVHDLDILTRSMPHRLVPVPCCTFANCIPNINYPRNLCPTYNLLHRPVRRIIRHNHLVIRKRLHFYRLQKPLYTNRILIRRHTNRNLHHPKLLTALSKCPPHTGNSSAGALCPPPHNPTNSALDLHALDLDLPSARHSASCPPMQQFCGRSRRLRAATGTWSGCRQADRLKTPVLGLRTLQPYAPAAF